MTKSSYYANFKTLIKNNTLTKILSFTTVSLSQYRTYLVRR